MGYEERREKGTEERDEADQYHRSWVGLYPLHAARIVGEKLGTQRRATQMRERRGEGGAAVKKMQISVAPVNKGLCVNHRMKWHI